ncbi:MAG: hypothetical protein ACI85I_002219 [Arenicella sp.]|jgi:hypothetical protein
MKTFSYLIIALLFSFPALAQDNLSASSEEDEKSKKERIPLKEKIYYSLTPGFNFSSSGTFGSFYQLSLSGSAGYKFTNFLSAGVGLNYLYEKNSTFDFSTNAYGGRTFLRGKTEQGIVGSLEYDTYLISRSSAEKRWLRSALIGGGYSQQLNSGLSTNIMLFYNLTFQSDNDFYQTEFVPRIEVLYNF